MSDEDLRRGYRAMISGGMSGLGNDQIAKLGQEVARDQRERGETPTVSEVQYLQEFVQLSENHITESVSNGYFSAEVQNSLDALNAKFPDIAEAVRRTKIICPGLGDTLSDEGWMSSSYEC